MSLWVDRYRPLGLGLRFGEGMGGVLHTGVNERLESLASCPGSVPHLLFYGPNGSGRRTRILGFLRELFGDGVYRVKVSDRSFRPAAGKSEITLSTLHSNYHIELNPSDVGSNDRHVIQHLFREIAESGTVRPIDCTASTTATASATATSNDEKKKQSELFKVVVINSADRLSRDAQAALRRTMEKYMTHCRVIMCCEHLTHIIEPIQSRCQLIRVPAPQPAELISLLRSVALAEGLELPDKDATHVITRSDRNIRHALLLLQSIRHTLPTVATKTTTKTTTTTTQPSSPPPSNTVAVNMVGVGMGTDWEQSIEELAGHMLEDQSVKAVYWCRERLLELLTHLIPPEIILKTLVEAVYRKASTFESISHYVCKLAAECDIRLAKASKPILHLEFFVTHLIAHLASTLH
jgi:replication factor C subunit 3/5